MNQQTRFVKSVFDQLAPSYDLLNRVLSLGRDVSWRRFATRKLLEGRGKLFLDVAAGTCEVSLDLVRVDPAVRAVAIDFTFPMLARGKIKIGNALQTNRICLALADGLSLPFAEGSFDGATIGFGIRNISDRRKALCEMARVVTPGGVLVVLEFTVPAWGRFQPLYRFFLSRILPPVGGLLSKSREAYQYLSDSIMRFPRPDVFRKMMEGAGFTAVTYWPLTLGIVGVYVGKRS
jgi:demethylmenaquinone methyltransferase/2-methoxy-6-polyprenyl-1,4-benzoquinol methylase